MLSGDVFTVAPIPTHSSPNDMGASRGLARPSLSIARRRPRPLIHTSTRVHNARHTIVGHKHLIGGGLGVRDAVAAVGALRGADDDHAAGSDVAGEQAVELAPLLADGEFGAVVIARAGGPLERPEAAEL